MAPNPGSSNSVKACELALHAALQQFIRACEREDADKQPSHDAMAAECRAFVETLSTIRFSHPPISETQGAAEEGAISSSSEFRASFMHVHIG